MSVAVMSNASRNGLPNCFADDLLAATNISTNTLPLLSGPLVWNEGASGPQAPHTLLLGHGDIEELRDALATFKGHDLGLDDIAPANFPLPTISARLEECATVLHHGRGCVLVKGLDKGDFADEDATKVYIGLSSYIADQRGQQDKKGSMLTHVTTSKVWTVPVEKRHGIHSQQALPFHNDMGCDILALQARRSAPTAGFTYLSSAWTVYNSLLMEEPEVLQSLLTPDWPVQISGKEASFYLAPLFELHQGRLLASMDPNRLGPHPSCDPVNRPPALTEEQQYALSRVSEVARRTEVRLRLETGDLLFFNNWALLHRRDGYQDDAKTSRHLIRLWLRNNRQGWDVPDSMLQPWSAAYRPKTKSAVRTYALHPSAEYTVPKYTAGSAAFIIEDSDDEDDDSTEDAAE